MGEYFVFDILNTFLRLAVTAILVVKLTKFYANFKQIERIGMGLIASGSFLTIPPIWMVRPNAPVFDGWSTSVMTFGLCLYFTGRMMRHVRHNRANDAQARYFEAYFRSKNNGE